jgi:hypothetical protein
MHMMNMAPSLALLIAHQRVADRVEAARRDRLAREFRTVPAVGELLSTARRRSLGYRGRSAPVRPPATPVLATSCCTAE